MYVKVQALNVTLREPDMEVSTFKEAGTERFDNPTGVTAAIAGDSDMDEFSGLISSIRVPCGKLEPRVRDDNLFFKQPASFSVWIISLTGGKEGNTWLPSVESNGN